MRKKLLYSTFAILGIITIFLIYLSVFGVKTEKFNDLIIDKIKQFDSRLSLNINDVFLKLNIKEKSININTQNTIINIDNEFINISEIDLNLDLLNFLSSENSVKKIKISIKKNKIKKITEFLNSYKFSIPRLIIYNQIIDGNIEAKININFNEKDQIGYDYNVIAKVNDGELNILNKLKVKKINFDINIQDNKYVIKNANFNNEGINFNSKKILVKKIDENYEVDGDLFSKKGFINPSYFSKIFNFNIEFLDKKKIIAETKNSFKFKVNPEHKIKNLELSSKINFKEIYLDKKIQNLLFLKNGTVNTSYKKNILELNIDSGYSYIKDNYKNNEKDKIKIKIVKKKNQDLSVEAIVENENNSINSSELSNFFKINNKIINDQDLTFGSVNQIAFKVDNKDKLKNLNIKSKINLDKILINYKSSRIKKIFPGYKNVIKLKENLIIIDFSEFKTKIDTKGNYSFEKETDKFNFEILKNNNNLKFNSTVEISGNPILIKDINYKKKKDIFSKIEINGKFYENNEINIKNFSYLENENKFLVSNLFLSDNYKIIDIDKLQLKYFNNDKKLNHLDVSKKNNKFELISKSFDGKSIINNLLTENSKKSLLERFKNLNSELSISFDKFIVSKNDYLKNVIGSLIIKKNKIHSGRISAQLNDKNDFSFNVKTNENQEKVTNLFIDNPKPFIQNYKFIKGFEEGKLSYASIEKNDVTISNLKISNFKIKEVPVLAKILILASLQGIADLLTGEGIRFDDFEMDYESSNNSTKIKEMYAIGPAISILMDGYIIKSNNLTSLSGTLVPATTINKTISKIPLLGNILVGKKAGEGVFGVSFKIKGPPKNLKTTVNPVKTLTPRFITRTLDKLKKN
tara:strand:- start:688 stop:3276 length:2589 start_codon:yes stop_codon:yes gene_type:complete